MALERYVKLSAAAKLCGMDRRTLLLRLKEKGFVVPPNRNKRPLMIRERDIREVMGDCTVLPEARAAVSLRKRERGHKESNQ